MVLLKQKALLLAQYLKCFFVNKKIPERFSHQNVPYYSQWESPELTSAILSGKILASADPLWQNSGAVTPTEYELWSWNACGMACLKMLLEHKQALKVPLVTLAKQCLSYGGYQEPLLDSPGLFYKPFCTFVSTEYQLDAAPVAALTITEIINTISQSGYIIASVNPAIRDPNGIPTSQGGHLILVFGYNKKTKTLYFHNPSGGTTQNQSNVSLSYKLFKKFFAYKGIVISG